MQGNDNDAASGPTTQRQIGGQESGVGNDFLWHKLALCSVVLFAASSQGSLGRF
jgi:hypothetical protein